MKQIYYDARPRTERFNVRLKVRVTTKTTVFRFTTYEEMFREDQVWIARNRYRVPASLGDDFMLSLVVGVEVNKVTYWWLHWVGLFQI
jgi:hypothetical protein